MSKIITTNFKDSVVFTVDEAGLVECWSPIDTRGEAGDKKAFNLSRENYVYATNSYEQETKRIVLVSDGGVWFRDKAKTAPHCRYAAAWFGDYPYGSWAIGLRQCLTTGKMSWSEFSTDINPRGLSDAERWEERCQEYKPELVVA